MSKSEVITNTYEIQSEKEGWDSIIRERDMLREKVNKYKSKIEEAYARDISVCEMELENLQALLIPVVCECIDEKPGSFCEVCERDEKIRLSKLVIAIKNYIDSEKLRIGLENDSLIEYKREIMKAGEQIEGYKSQLKDCNAVIVNQRKELTRLNAVVNNRFTYIEEVIDNREVSEGAEFAKLNDVYKITMLKAHLTKEIGNINTVLGDVEKQFSYFMETFGVDSAGKYELEQELMPRKTKSSRVVKSLIEEYERFIQSRLILTNKKAILHEIFDVCSNM